MVTTSRSSSSSSTSSRPDMDTIAKTSPPPIRVATLNVRYDGRSSSPVPIPDQATTCNTSVNTHHGLWKKAFSPDSYKEQPWSERRTPLADYFSSAGTFDIIGFQEVLHNQLEDLQTLLGPEYGSYGVGRDDGGIKGEYSPIFYKKSRFVLVDSATIWLSTTPEKPSVGWDASQTRIATQVTLSDKDSGHLTHAICTHWDDQGVKARAESALLIRAESHRRIETIERNLGAAPGAVILFGDFNSPQEEDGYKNITSHKPLATGQASFTFHDAFKILKCRPNGLQTRPYGPVNTYTGFAPTQNREAKRIDFIMLAAEAAPGKDLDDAGVVRARGGLEVAGLRVIDSYIVEDAGGFTGRFSDHNIVEATLTFA